MGRKDKEGKSAIKSRLAERRGLWPVTPQRARALQDTLRHKVKIRPLKKDPGLVAAVDAAFPNDSVIAVATLYDGLSMEDMQDVIVREKVRFPYIPGLLTFREGHAILNALKKLKMRPDVILVDGQGIAHPRGIGIASHIGVILGRPTVGCAKSRLVGEYDEPGEEKGNWTYLYYKGDRVGAVLRTRSNVKPLFVSPGHLTDIASSIRIVMTCLSRYRIPEPLRRADFISKKFRRGESR
jgi:deoxyribonuclease V